jgi:hypothetical protein
MPPKRNPLNLNQLQLKTLTLFQELARNPETSTRDADSGDTVITMIPHPHGNHFHIGHRVVMARDASGLHNSGVWMALIRKGLARPVMPVGIALTPAGVDYDTGLRDQILHGGDH